MCWCSSPLSERGYLSTIWIITLFTVTRRKVRKNYGSCTAVIIHLTPKWFWVTIHGLWNYVSPKQELPSSHSHSSGIWLVRSIQKSRAYFLTSISDTRWRIMCQNITSYTQASLIDLKKRANDVFDVFRVIADLKPSGARPFLPQFASRSLLKTTTKTRGRPISAAGGRDCRRPPWQR